MNEQGSASFLQQAHQNNWQQYLASLKGDAALGWDLCILTASNETQAALYRRQLEWRREGAVLPSRTRFLVIADPDGRRIGSGGATLRALLQAESNPSDRVLLIHSGGDSRRLPHCSATGKLFARVPRELPDGRASTVFDEFLISLSGLTSDLPPGVLVASGDVLLVFDHLQVSFGRPGVTGVAAASPAEMGMRHGIYVADQESKRLRAYLHKPSFQELTAWHAIDGNGHVQIDTGLVWLDGPTVGKLLQIASEQTVAKLCGPSPTAGPIPTEGLNLYGDMVLPLAESTTYEGYLANASDGAASADVQAARRVIWERMRGIPFSVERLQPAVFVHLGTSREYWEIAAGDPGVRRTCGWTARAASWVDNPSPPAPSPQAGKGEIESWGRSGGGAATPAPESSVELPDPGGDAEGRLVLINAIVEKQVTRTGGSDAALITDSHLSGPLSWIGAAIVASLNTGLPVALGVDLVMDQLPLMGGGHLTRLFGMHDDPKRPIEDPAATFMNRPWADWLESAGVKAELLWGDIPAPQRSLWNARLYAVSADREESVRLSIPLQDPANAPRDWLARWSGLERLSLGQSFARADGERILAQVTAAEDEAAAGRFFSAVQAERPALEAKGLLGARPVSLVRRCNSVAERLEAADPILRLRGQMALAVASGDSHWEDKAFSGLAAMIEAAMQRGKMASARKVSGRGRPAFHERVLDRGTVRVAAAARIDFGGGWTDTPPYGIERGGTVLNAAITLRGDHPVIAEAERLDEPRLILESRDIDSAIEPECAAEILAYSNPADPFALHKAALVLRGIVAKDVDPGMRLSHLMEAGGGGLRLTTKSTIPRGSGLGTSSILAGAVLACLSRLVEDDGVPGSGGPATSGLGSARTGSRGSEPPFKLFDEVLFLEQMLTTGGGWQDQVGGLTGGIKLITTQPGLPQCITVAPLLLTDQVRAELTDRLVLVYTGQQRLAKNLLRGVMGRWMSRDPDMVRILQQIARLAVAMKEALEGGDVQSFGEMLADHWMLNKQMDPGCSNRFIDHLFEVIAPFVNGAKLAGAGGGGFAIVVAKSRHALEEMRVELERRFSGTPVGIWDCAVPEEGMLYTT